MPASSFEALRAFVCFDAVLRSLSEILRVVFVHVNEALHEIVLEQIFDGVGVGLLLRLLPHLAPAVEVQVRLLVASSRTVEAGMEVGVFDDGGAESVGQFLLTLETAVVLRTEQKLGMLHRWDEHWILRHVRAWQKFGMTARRARRARFSYAFAYS